LTFAATPAQAQFGFGGVVYDPRNFAQAVLLYKRAYDQLTAAKQQLQAQITALQKLKHPAWRDVTTTLSQADAFMRAQSTLGYGLASLDADFQHTFPATAMLGNATPQLDTQTARTLATLRTVLDAVRTSTQAVPAGLVQLQTMKQQLATVPGHEAALELGTTVNTYSAEELTLLRQQLAAQINAEAVYFAHQVNQKAQARATEQAIWAWFAQPATPGRVISYQPR
jgi:P-type conjugative transfer protein TrbJ